MKSKSKQNITINTLAQMVQKGFGGMDKRFDIVDKRFRDVDKRLDGVERQLKRIEKIILTQHWQKIEKLEEEVQRLKEALAID